MTEGESRESEKIAETRNEFSHLRRKSVAAVLIERVDKDDEISRISESLREREEQIGGISFYSLSEDNDTRRAR